MRTGWAGFGSPLLAALLLLMVALVVITFWQVRRSEYPAATSSVRSASICGLLAGAVGTLMVTQVSWTPRYRIDRVDLNPFDDFTRLFSSSVVGSQALANLALLSWLGFFLPLAAPSLFTRRWAGLVMFVVGLVVAGSIEFGQLMWSSGRVSSVSDVLINASGVFLGYLVARVAFTTWQRPRSVALSHLKA